MKTNLNKIFCLATLIGLLALASCSSTKNLGSPKGPKAASHDEAYKLMVVNNQLKTKSLTAKLKINLQLDDKDISLSGNLRLKRGEVIQLTLNFPIIGEVGRMEFSPSEVLIMDRINARYIKASYEEVDFLRASNINYDVLESVFWDEVFYPGQKDLRSKLAEYSVASSGEHTLLSLTTAPKLDYAFLTLTESGLLDRTTVTSKNIQDQSQLTCIYGDFQKFDSGRFPTKIKVSFAGEEMSCALDLSLSSLSCSSDWEAHTTLSSRYKQVDLKSLFGSLFP